MRNISLINTVVIKKFHQYLLRLVFPVIFEDCDQNMFIIYCFSTIDYPFNL